jgi:glycosyltransferase involved in cell wall biosynthesis
MAMALPVVAYERPASREILGDLGIYAAYHDPLDLARVLMATLRDPELRRQRGAANRHKAIQAYAWEGLAQRLMSAYAQVSLRQK